MAKSDPATDSPGTGYFVRTGLNYGPTNTRAEVGDFVTDLPPESISWLHEQRHIETAEEKTSREAEQAELEAMMAADAAERLAAATYQEPVTESLVGPAGMGADGSAPPPVEPEEVVGVSTPVPAASSAPDDTTTDEEQ